MILRFSCICTVAAIIKCLASKSFVYSCPSSTSSLPMFTLQVFSSWMHFCAVRVFAESILRYGLPPSFLVIKLYSWSSHVSTLCSLPLGSSCWLNLA